MLRQDTARLWDILSPRRELDGFVLIGGTALSLHLDHRQSEDLDFAWPHSRLPRQPLAELIRNLPDHKFDPCPDPIALREADDCGMDLYDFSQDYLVDGVKLTFFCPDPPERQILLQTQTPSPTLRVATVAELFALKALVAAKRSKQRDWFDLYILMRDHGYAWKDFRQVFDDTQVPAQYERAAQRLSFGHPGRSDEGFDQLLPGPTVTVEEMQIFFSSTQKAYEITLGDQSPSI